MRANPYSNPSGLRDYEVRATERTIFAAECNRAYRSWPRGMIGFARRMKMMMMRREGNEAFVFREAAKVVG